MNIKKAILAVFLSLACIFTLNGQNPPGSYSYPQNGGIPGGSNGQVQYNNNGALGADSLLTYTANSGQLTLGTGGGGPFVSVNNGGGPASAGSFRSSRGTQEFCWGTNVLDGCIGNGGITSAAFGAAGLFATGTNSVSGCSLSAAAGGATAGKFASGTSGTCTVTITLPTAVNGWTCDAHDLTTAADANNVVQTAFTTTSATISGTTVSADVITWKCQGF